MRVASSAVVALLSIAAFAETPPPFPAGVHLRPSRVAVHRGSGFTVRGRLDLDYILGGRLPAWWMIRDVDGRCLAFGRAVTGPVDAIGIHHGLVLHPRVPADRRSDGAQLDVLVMEREEEDDGGLLAAGVGTIPLYVPEGRSRVRSSGESWTGTLRPTGSYAFPLFVPDGAEANGFTSYSLILLGEAVSDILRNPFWAGSRVTIEGHAILDHFVRFPEGPWPFRADRVTWEGPLPEDLGGQGGAAGAMPARIAPAELIGQLDWRTLMRASRQPRVIEDQAGLDALRDEILSATGGTATPNGWPAGVDFAGNRVVAVFAGVSPDDAWRVQVLDAHHDAGAGVTKVRYAVIGPRPGHAGVETWVEPWTVGVIPRRPGTVEFEREEFLPDRPAWW
jgi:hypothetical protein